MLLIIFYDLKESQKIATFCKTYILINFEDVFDYYDLLSDC